ncbi:hypothetical protein BJX96DRAFT_150164 [Aspergillus floccosus]
MNAIVWGISSSYFARDATANQPAKSNMRAGRIPRDAQPATDVIPIQHHSKIDTCNLLFLFPDRSVSLTPYAAFEDLHPDFAVSELVCPFINRPKE